MTPNMRKVQGVPIAFVNDKKDWATARFAVQFTVAAIPPQMPLYLSG